MGLCSLMARVQAQASSSPQSSLSPSPSFFKRPAFHSIFKLCFFLNFHPLLSCRCLSLPADPLYIIIHFKSTNRTTKPKQTCGESMPKTTSSHRINHFFLYSGIFGYINYLVEKDRDYILKTLINGLSRLEYRMFIFPPARKLSKLTVAQVDTIPLALPLTVMKRMKSLRSRRSAKSQSSRISSNSQSQI